MTFDAQRSRILIEGYCDGQLTEAEFAELEDLLQRDAAARAELRAYLSLDAALWNDAAAMSPAAPGPETPTVAANADKFSRQRTYSLVTAAVLLLCIGLPIVWSSRTPHTAAPSTPLATLIAERDAVWDGHAPRRPRGTIFGAEILRLRQGEAQLSFASGTTITLLGPAELSISGASAATLRSGRLNFANHGPHVTFDLRTPFSELVDLGTSYAVALGDGFEEVRVFEGEVWRTPNNDSDAATLIDAGETRRFGPVLPPFGKRLHRAPLVQEPSPAPAVMARDPFAYESRVYDAETALDGGVGWKGPWVWHARDAMGHTILDTPLTVEDHFAVASGVFFLRRGLAQPIRLETEGETWFSVRLGLNATDSAEPLLFVTLRTAEEIPQTPSPERLVVLFNGRRNQLLLRFGGRSYSSPLKIDGAAPQLLVGRIAHHRLQRDQVSLGLVPDGSRLDAAQPPQWLLESQPADCHGALDELVFHFHAASPMRIGAVRFARTWADLVDASPQP